MSWFRGQDFHSEHESNAEVELLKAFHFAHRRGELKETPLTGHMITIEDRDGGLFETRPDFWWMQSEICLFLDGPYHLGRQGKYDEQVDCGLAKKGIMVVRVPYSPPISQKKIREILEQVKQAQSHRSLHASQ